MVAWSLSSSHIYLKGNTLCSESREEGEAAFITLKKVVEGPKLQQLPNKNTKLKNYRKMYTQRVFKINPFHKTLFDQH
jgi:hypothetical protein